MYKRPTLVRIALWVLGAVDVIVFVWQAVTEWQRHPNFLQGPLDHQVLVVEASALLLAQIMAIGLAVSGLRPGAGTLRSIAAAVVLAGAAVFNAASFLVLGVQLWALVDPQLKAQPGALAMIAFWVPANVAAFSAAWRCRPWAASPAAKAALGRMLRWAGLALLLVVCIAFGWLKLFGVHIDTTGASFVPQSDSPYFVVTPQGMHVQLGVTPSKDPSEAGWIYLAAEYGVPIDVTIPLRERKFEFRITGLSPEGDFVVPCSSKAKCAEILLATDFELPPELSGAR